MCVCGVTECPVTTLSVSQQGDHPFAVCDGPTKRPQQMRISRLITSTYLCIACDSKSFWPPWLRRCLCFLFFRVTCSRLDGNQVNASRTYTHSRLISCTRDSSVVLERLALSIWSLSVYTPFVGNPRVYPLCDPGPALSENLTSTCLS